MDVKGEFIGGCDIVREMFQASELQQLFRTGIATRQAAEYLFTRRGARAAWDIRIDSVRPFADGHAFGEAGSYERLKGVARGRSIRPIREP